MATKNIVPRADGEGGLGTAAKQWSDVQTKHATITAIRGTELAPAITEANWDTNQGGFIHPLVGGVIDKGTGDTWTGDVVMTTPIGVSVGDVYEVAFTVVVSPTSGTFVAGDYSWISIGIDPEVGPSYALTGVGTFTYIQTALTTNALLIGGSQNSRFGISAISVKKLTEGNLTMDGGQIKAETFMGGTPGFASTESPTTGLCVGTGVCKLVVGGTQVVDFVGGIPTAANDAAAATAGVPIGGFYRTDADPSHVCVRTA
jgi:hypothetical protein